MWTERIRSFFFHWSIQLKLVSIISLIILISITGIIYIATYFFKKDNEIRIKENTLEVTQLIAGKTKADITGIIKEGIDLSNQVMAGRLLGIPKKSIKQTIDGLYETEEIIALYLFTNSSQKPILVKAAYSDFFFKNQGWNPKLMDKVVAKSLKTYANAAKRETIILNSSVDSTPLVGVSYPYRNGNAGFFVVISQMDGILSSLKNSGITENFILTKSGTVLAHSKKELVPGMMSRKDSILFEKIQKSPISNGQLKYLNKDDEYFIASFRKLGIGDLTVVAEVSEEKAMEEVNNIQRRNFFLLIIILSLSILVVLVFSKKLTDPILRLVSASRKIEKGDFHIEIEQESGDEIGVLTKSFANMAKGLSERDKIKDAFGKFVNTELAEQVLQGELTLGGSRKECTIFFSDIRDFTANSEVMEPEDVVEFLNEYMTIMVGCVNRHGGVVDKFIGDSIMAVWGAINTSEDDTANAIYCALDMRDALQNFNKTKRKKEYPFIRIGIGINTGDVISGQIGSEERLEFTVVGDSVNLASRIEALNKEFQTDILVSETSYEKTNHLFDFLKMKSIQVKGKKKAQTIYAVLGKKGVKSNPSNITELRKLSQLSLTNSSPKKQKPTPKKKSSPRKKS